MYAAELVLYADSPGRVHSDFCVMVVGPGDLKTLQHYKLLIGDSFLLIDYHILFYNRRTIRLEKSTDTNSFHARAAQNSYNCMRQTIGRLSYK